MVQRSRASLVLVSWQTAGAIMKLFQCQACGQPLYFENTRCESCGRELGYLPSLGNLTALEPNDGESWFALASPDEPVRLCANAAHGACNWLVSVSQASPYCLACRHNRTIPDLSNSQNLTRWRHLESAKRRLF